MALPAHWKLVTVFGTYLRSDGSANVGSIWFESASPVYVDDDTGTRVLVVPRRLECPLDATGTFSIDLPTTDDPDINPVGWTYAVREQISGGREYAIDVPSAMDTINLVTWPQATPVPDVPPTQSYLTTLDIGVNVASQTDMDAANVLAAQAAADSVTALESATDAHGIAVAAASTANAIAGTANNALATANAANATAVQASADAATANATANAIAGTANTALTQSAAAVTTANGIAGTANTALTAANAANTTAGNANTTANAANTTANNAQTTANGLAASIAAANTTAGNALTVANTAEADAQSAITNANGRQPHDATLDGIAALTVAIGQVLYTTATDTFAATALTAFGRSLIDDADAATARNTLGLGGSAILPVGTGAATVAAGDDARFLRMSGFKNKLINGDFGIWQRGTALAAYQGATAYLADRWKTTAGNTTIAPSLQAFTPGQTAVPGGPTNYHRVVVASVANAGSYALLTQAIEGVEQFSGRSCTLSFWAKADAAKPVGIEISKNYGSGGSTAENGVLTTSKALTTGWALYTYTFTVPANTGKTVGAGSALALNFWFDCGSSFTSRGTIGQQSGTFDIAAVQLEFGAVATDFEQRPPALELSLCQRYCRKSFPQSTTPANNSVAGVFGCSVSFSGTSTTLWLPYGTNMRTTPSVTLYSPNVGTPTNGQPSAFVLGGWVAGSTFTSGGNESGLQIVGIFTGATTIGAYYTQFNYLADAEI